MIVAAPTALFASPAQAKAGVRRVSLEFISGNSGDPRWRIIIVLLKTISL